MYSFTYLEPVCCSMSGSNCFFLTYIQVSQEAGKAVWYSHLFKNFPQFVMIHLVKGFSIVSEAEGDVFLEFSCFICDPTDHRTDRLLVTVNPISCNMGSVPYVLFLTLSFIILSWKFIAYRRNTYNFSCNRLPWWLRWWSDGQQCGRHRFNPWVGKVLWRRKWQPTPVLLPAKSHGRRSLVGYSPWGHKESDMTERLHFLSLFLIE